MLPPSNIFVIYVDGVNTAQLFGVSEWMDVELGLQPGPHRVDFSYQYNIFQENPVPPSPPRRQGEFCEFCSAIVRTLVFCFWLIPCVSLFTISFLIPIFVVGAV